MALLPELLYRFAFASSYMHPIQFPDFLPDGTPLLLQDASWDNLLLQAVPEHRPPTKMPNSVADWLERVGFHLNRPDPTTQINWMPAARYSHFWPRMKAFALPSYYDGRIRLNVVGREAKGIVEPNQYETVCKQIADVISDCRNLQTDKSVVREIYAPKKNFNDVGPTETDLYLM
jgi:hypothetical protein